MTENKITKDGIKELFKLDTKAKKVYNVDYNFQILSLKKNENNTEKAIYSATFSDAVHKYSGIVIIINDSNLNLQPFDLIKVKQLTISTFLKGNSQVETVIFIIKLFELVETCAKKFGNPIDFKFIKPDKEEDKDKDKDKDKEKEKERERDSKKVKVEEEKVEHTVSSNPNSFFIRPSPSATSSVDNSTNLSSEKNLLESFSKTKFDYNISNNITNTNIKEENSKDKESITNYFPSTSNSKVKYMPLSYLNTYSRNFTILVRIINKNEMKQYNNTKGGGNLFTFVMLDKEGTEMECTVFGNLGYRVYESIKQGQTYEIKGGYIKLNDKKFSQVKNDYKLFLEETVIINEVKEEVEIKQAAECDFITIESIAKLETEKNIDIVGKLLEVGEKSNLTIKKKGTHEIKKIVVIDDSNTAVEVTLWGKHVLRKMNKGEIIALRNMKINFYNGRSLNSTDATIMLTNTDVPEPMYSRIKNYFDKSDNIVNYKSLKTESANFVYNNIGKVWFISDMLTFLERNNEIINYNEDKVPLFKVKASISNFIHSEKYLYLACIECKKKMSEDNNLTCSSCNKSFPRPNYVFAINLKIKDCSMDYWVNVYGNWAEKIMKIEANDYKELLTNKDQIKLDELLNEIEYEQYYFLLRPKISYYNGNSRLILSVLKIEELEVTSEMRRVSNLLLSYFRPKNKKDDLKKEELNI